MDGVQAPNLDAYTVGFGGDGVVGVVAILLVVGLVMVGWILLAFAIGRIHPFRIEMAEDKKKKPTA